MQMFTGDGDFLTKWGSLGTGEGQFNLPYAIRAGGNDLVYVADSSNHRVQKFFFARVPEPCEGDADGDGLVDPLDSGYVLARFGCPVGEGDPDCDTADMNGDGVVDPLDSGYVLARFGTCPWEALSHIAEDV